MGVLLVVAERADPPTSAHPAWEYGDREAGIMSAFDSLPPVEFGHDRPEERANGSSSCFVIWAPAFAGSPLRDVGEARVPSFPQRGRR